jgi:hypothetical protein
MSNFGRVLVNAVAVTWLETLLSRGLIHMAVKIECSYVFIYFCGTEDQSQGLVHTRQALNHWATSPALGFFETVSWYITLSCLELVNFLPPPPQCWYYRCALLCSAATSFLNPRSQTDPVSLLQYSNGQAVLTCPNLRGGVRRLTSQWEECKRICDHAV